MRFIKEILKLFQIKTITFQLNYIPRFKNLLKAPKLTGIWNNNC